MRPEVHGHVERRFEPVADELRSQLARFGGGAAACVMLEGEPVVDLWGGVGWNDGTPWRRDTMCLSWSATKGMASTLVHSLASDGLLDYEEPMATYWPEFAQNGKETITVRQVLSHQAGLHRTGSVLRHLNDVLDWDHVVSELARATPDFEPGKANAYHALTQGWLLGELVQRVSGKRFPEALRERVTGPLGLDGMYIGVPEQELHRVAEVMGSGPRLPEGSPTRRRPIPFWVPPGPLRWLYRRGFDPASLSDLVARPELLQVPIPSMNGVCTARSLARMYAALAEGGTFDGARIVSPAILRRMAAIQTRRLDRVVIYPLHWRLGYHRADAIVKSVPEAFGHYGFGGTGGWANPSRRLAAAFVHNASPITIRGQVRSVWLTGAVYRSLGEYHGLLRTFLGDGPSVFAA